MPEPKIRLPKYRHYKPKNLAVVRIDGRDVDLGKYNSPESRERDNQVLAEWLTTGSAPVPARPDGEREVFELRPCPIPAPCSTT
jgi:hypothetical protein